MEESKNVELEESIFHAMRPPKLYGKIDVSKIKLNEDFFFDTPPQIEQEENEDEDIYYPNSEENGERSDDFARKPFTEIACMMSLVDRAGLVKKKVNREGAGDAVPADSTVIANYKLFKEKSVGAFDSTWLRRHSRFSLSDRGGLLPGLSIALKSMRVGELSWFLISPELMFQDHGHPPRVGPGETILAEIELLELMAPSNFVEPDSYFVNDLFQEVNKLKRDAKKAFVNGNMSVCIRMYKNSLVILENMETACDETRAERDDLTKTIRINLAVAYNKGNYHEKALQECKIVLQKDTENEKAIFHCGRAFLNLHKFNEAIETLRKGLNLNPDNRTFQDEMKKVQEAKAASDLIGHTIVP